MQTMNNPIQNENGFERILLTKRNIPLNLLVQEVESGAEFSVIANCFEILKLLLTYNGITQPNRAVLVLVTLRIKMLPWRIQ
jgi:hypothetical protein